MAQETIWTIEEHTRAKHVILRRYLNAWYPILTRYNGRVIYCDGFAGPGSYSGGEDGSPIIALRTLHEHAFNKRIRADVCFLFIEQDEARCNALRKSVADYLSSIDRRYSVRVECSTFDDTLTEILDYMDQKGSRLAPTLCFVDPFGVSGVSLSSLTRLMRNPQCELLITFMIGYFDRFIGVREFEYAADEMFGTSEWRAAQTLVGHNRTEFLRQLYQRQLESVVGAEYVRYFTMQNERNRPIYDLFFASTHSKGIDRMKDSMWGVDPEGTYRFTDATSPDQQVLLGGDSVDRDLVELLFDRFNGTTQKWCRLEDAIRRSPYRITKTPIQRYAKQNPDELEILPEHGKRAWTLSDGATVKFNRNH